MRTFSYHFFGPYLPIVIDCETSGINPLEHAILEIAYVVLNRDEEKLCLGQSENYHVIPFEGAKFDPAAMQIHQIDHTHPFRFAVSEKDALLALNTVVSQELKKSPYKRAVLVGHNAWFDLSFLNAAYARQKIPSPFHRFTTLDTATLGALFFKETVLAKALAKSHLGYHAIDAHSALYDAEKTAQLFCYYWNKSVFLRKKETSSTQFPQSHE